MNDNFCLLFGSYILFENVVFGGNLGCVFWKLKFFWVYFGYCKFIMIYGLLKDKVFGFLKDLKIFFFWKVICEIKIFCVFLLFEKDNWNIFLLIDSFV